MKEAVNNMIAGCFNLSQPNAPSSNTSSTYSSQSQSRSQAPQNVVTCIYQTQLGNSPTYLTLSWSKTLFSHSLTISATDIFSITVSLNSSTFSFFRTRHGSKSIHHRKLKLHWNFTRAEFIQNSAEPDSRFYLAISHNGKLEFFLGDLLHVFPPRYQKDTCSETVLLSRREHIFGSRSYVSRAAFMGTKHVIEITFGGGVQRVREDVHRRGGSGVLLGLGDGTVWPEMVAAEKKLMKKTVSGSSVLQWAEESSDCGRTSCSSSTRSSASNATGFSLLLYAWSVN
ncbi:hypothetical protein Fmac_007059 [Flemingia macrophylla]|uniref:Uncharacterized protein n=1 Tax=Flemingia macrophylla TaxID=520843 RepID=A0ABD1NCD9_9FABA